MASVNKVILIGNLGADPEMRYMTNGDAVCNLRIATTETWKDKNSGEKKEATEWHRIVIFRKLGEIAGQYLQKGSSVYIEGQLKTRKWTDKDGHDQYTTEVVADEMRMLGSPNGASRSNDNAPRGNSGNGQRSGGGGGNGRPASFDDDDIPFGHAFDMPKRRRSGRL